VNFPAVIALKSPKAIPKKSQIAPAPIASDSVAGRSWRIWSSTFACWV